MDDSIRQQSILIKELEEGMWTFEHRSNGTWLDRYLHDDFAEVGRSGQRYKRVNYVPNSIAPFEATIPLPNFELKFICHECALATYDSEFKQGDKHEFAHRSSIWVYTDDRWQLIYHQGTAFKP